MGNGTVCSASQPCSRHRLFTPPDVALECRAPPGSQVVQSPCCKTVAEFTINIDVIVSKTNVSKSEKKTGHWPPTSKQDWSSSAGYTIRPSADNKQGNPTTRRPFSKWLSFVTCSSSLQKEISITFFKRRNQLHFFQFLVFTSSSVRQSYCISLFLLPLASPHCPSPFTSMCTTLHRTV